MNENSIQEKLKRGLKAGNSVQILFSASHKNLKILLYGCKTGSFALREECRKTDPEVNVWAKRGENGEWRKLYNEKLHSLYYSSNIVMVIKSRSLRWAGDISKMEEGKSTGKRPLGTP